MNHPKTRFTALALALAFSLPALAADVTVYGIIDMGLSLSRSSGSGEGAADGSWTASMKSGMRNSSRVGLKGVEDLGNGYKVFFILENQFLADSGEFQTDGTMWEREASVAVAGPFGKITAGRLGKLRSPVGSTGLCNTYNVNPFGNSMSNFVAGHKTMTSGNYFPHNNSIVYTSPKMGGAEFFAQYSLGDDDDAGEMDDNDRYMALAGRYFSGPLKATLIVDTIDRADSSSRSRQPTTVTAAVNYDFGFVHPFLYVHYFHHGTVNTVGSYMRASGYFDGLGGMFTLQAPVPLGKVKLGLGFMKAESSSGQADADVTRRSIAVGWDYPMSRTFHVYADAGYVDQKLENDSVVTSRLRGTEFLMGCVKYF